MALVCLSTILPTSAGRLYFIKDISTTGNFQLSKNLKIMVERV